MTGFLKKTTSKIVTTIVTCAMLLSAGASVALLQDTCNHKQAQAKTLASASGTWHSTAGQWWYAYDAGGYAKGGWQPISGTWYHFNAAGYMQTGWIHDGGAWYYLSPSGAMQTGWVRSAGTWYYLKDSGAMAKGWQKVKNTWYYMNASGAMQTGWVKVGSSWYYLTRSGAMATGWQKVGGDWYLLGSSGAMKTGWQKVGSDWYYLYPSGAMAANKWVGNYWLGSDGAMVTNGWVDNGKYYVGPTGVWDPNTRNESSLTYSYEMQVLNPASLYSDQPVIVYLKTKNPNPDSIEIVSDDNVPVKMLICDPYDDVRLKDPEAPAACLQALADGSGYVATISLTNPGVHGIRVIEYKYSGNASKPSSRAFTHVLTHLDINDYNAALSNWMELMLAIYTDGSMTPPEKMEALCEVFDGSDDDGGLFKFDPIIYLVDPSTTEDPSNPDYWRFARLVSNSMAFFESYTWDSLTAPTIMCMFAERIGGFSDIHNCYYDHVEETDEWDETHYYCKAIYEGEEYLFEACPNPDTNVVTTISYINL